MPKAKRAEQPAITSTFGKLKILYRHEGGLWIGGDRPNPIQLPESLDPTQVVGFNNHGSGDRYLVVGKDSTGQLKTLASGDEFSPPSGWVFSAAGSNLNAFFEGSNYKDNGLFIQSIPNARYWSGDKYGATGGVNGVGDVFIYPDVIRESILEIGIENNPGGGVPDYVERQSSWYVRFADVGVTATIVENFGKNSRFDPLFSRKYVYRNGSLKLFAESIQFQAFPPADGFYAYPNWVGESLYSIPLTASPGDDAGAAIAANNLKIGENRQTTIAVADETVGYYSIFKNAGTVQTQTWAIPADAIALFYSYNPN
jgi:hypothetical protein